MGGKLSQKNGRRFAGASPILKSDFALPEQNAYPIDTVGRARNALSRIAQNGTPEQKAKVRKAVQRRYQSVQVNLAGDSMKCPSCGHTGSTGDFSYSEDDASSNGSGAGGAPGSKVGAQAQPQADSGSTGFRPQQVGVKGMANRRRGIELAQRVPVRSLGDILVSRVPGGPAVIRHRQGGALVAEMRHNDNGSWQPVVDGKQLTEHVQQRAALMEAIGSYNRGAAPLTRPAPQPSAAMSAIGVTNINAFASGGSDDDDGDGDSDDDSGSDSTGLSPRGQAIYKKLTGKGVAPKVALAMAKRAQATKPGQFGKAG